MKRHVLNAFGVSVSLALIVLSYVIACWQLDLMRDVIACPDVNSPSDLFITQFGFPWVNGTLFMPLQRAWDLTMIVGGVGLLIAWLTLFTSLWWWGEE